MAIQLQIAGTPVIMTKFFTESDKDSILKSIDKKKSILFVDTPSTEQLYATIVALKNKNVEVAIRDHHGITNPKNEREEEIHFSAQLVREKVGKNAIISTREEHAGCSTLIEPGEFVSMDAIIADPDPDGLLGAMKALGVVYAELDSDAAILDGPRSGQTAENLSVLAALLVKGTATLPPFNPKNPTIAENAKGDLFSLFVSAVEGNSEARTSLETKVEEYEKGVEIAKELILNATTPIKGVKMVDVVGSSRYDLTTLTQGLESDGVMITVVRKDNGPIAAVNKVQYSIAVVRKYQEEVNLQDMLPVDFTSSPETGIISNTTFLLHLSEEVWKERILPALQERFG